MVKQTKTFKKGNVTKKALSAILAASMVMTSSSFVMAAPVEVEDVAVEAAAEVAVGAEENVGVTLNTVNVTVAEATYTGEKVTPAVTVVGDGTTLTENVDYTLTYANNEEVTDNATVTVKFDKADSSYFGNDDVTKTFSIKPLVLNASSAKVTYAPQGFVYNGKAQKVATPTVQAYDSKVDALVKNSTKTELAVVAYDSSYDLKSLGAQKAKLVDKKGNIVFDDSIGVYNFNIEQAEFSLSTVAVTSEAVLYTGSPVAANVVVKAKNTDEVVDPSTYTIKYYDKNGKAASGPQTDVKLKNGQLDSYKIEIVSNGTGNFKAGTVESSYKIIVGNFEDAVKTATIAGAKKDATVSNKDKFDLTYNGKEQSIAPSDISIPGLTQGVDYDVDCSAAYGKNVVYESGNVAKAFEITLTGKNKYSGSLKLKVFIQPAVINTTDFTIKATCDKLASAAGPAKADMIVTINKGDVALVSGTDFEIKDDSDIDASKRTVNIYGKGNYTTVDSKRDDKAYITVSYTQATKKLIKDTMITPISQQTWTGKQITPAVVVTDGSLTLEKGVDYTVSYGTNVDSGEKAGKVIVTGIGKYEGTVEKAFDIVGSVDINPNNKPIFNANASDVTVDAVKAGNGKSTPRITFTNGASAPSDFTYSVKYYSYNASTATKGAELTDAAFKGLKKDDVVYFEVTGTGKYKGTISSTYNVKDAIDISDVATVDAIANQAYTGKAIEPAVVVKVKTGNAQGVSDLKQGTDYTVSYEYNTQVGTAYALVTGKGVYAGEIAVPFKIVGEMDQTIEVLAAQERDLGNGTRTLNSKATKIKYTAETAVTFESSNPEVVTVDAEGNIKYTGLGEATITIEAKAENGYKAAKKEVKVVVTLAKPSFTPFSKNNAFTLTSSTVNGAEKFEVEYATKKDFSNSKTKTFATTSAGKVRQVKVSAGDKKTYYVRVRAISGTETSKWSAVKTVATK